MAGYYGILYCHPRDVVEEYLCGTNSHNLNAIFSLNGGKTSTINYLSTVFAYVGFRSDISTEIYYKTNQIQLLFFHTKSIYYLCPLRSTFIPLGMYKSKERKQRYINAQLEPPRFSHPSRLFLDSIASLYTRSVE